MRPRTLAKLLVSVVASIAAVAAHAQVAPTTWNGAASGLWTAGSNWSSAAVPNNLTTDAVVSATGSAYTVTGSGAASINARKLDVTSANASVLFDFASTSYSLNLGNATSSWSAGLVEFRTANGIFGNGSGSTTLNIASGAQLLFSTITNPHYFGSLTLNNAGLIHANGTEVVFQSGVPLANTGTLRATGAAGLLRFNGTYTTANLGTVDLVSGGRAVLGGTINNASATLNAPTGGSYELLGGTINGGSVAASALKFTSSAGTLNGVALTGDLDLNGNNLRVDFTGGTTFSGTNAVFGANAGVYWKQVGSLTGNALTFGTNGYLYVSGANNALTLGAGTTATGNITIYTDGASGTAVTNQGAITHTVGSGSIYAPTFTNSGSISATAGTLFLGYPNTYNSTNAGSGSITSSGSGTTVYVRGNFANNGVLTAQNSGVLLFDGTNATGNLGNVQLATSGRALLSGTLTNTALAAPTGGSFELYGGTITGGTIAAGALSFTSNGGYLDGATLNDNLNVAANAFVRFTGNASFSGGSATLGNNGGVYWEQIGTLSGKALTFGSGAYYYVNGNNNTLTLAGSTTATGDVSIYSSGSAGTAITNQGVITHTTGSGSIYAPTFTNSGSITATAGTLYLGYPNTYNSTNAGSGSITSSGSGTTVYIRGNFANNGVLTAQNSGVLFFDGTNATGNLGNVQLATSGRALLNGTLTNTALAAPTGGSFELYGGTITGGTIAPAALSFTSSGGYLDGATLNDNLTLPANAYVRFTGNGSFSGGTATLGTNSGVYWEQVGTLSGKTLTFGSGAYYYVNGNNNTLTLAGSTTATGNVSIYSSGSAGTAITNQGVITHTAGNGSIYAPTFTNSGSITATAGTLYLGYPNTYNSTNAGSGSITSSGSGTTVYIRGNFSNNGVLTAQNSGVLLFDGTNATGNLGNVQLATSGRALLNGTLTNTALTAPTGGSFELYGGTITGGTIAPGALAFTSSGGYLDGATLNDNLTLPANAYVRFTGNGSFSGGTATLGANSGVYWEQVGALNSKALTLGSGAYLYVSGLNHTLTLGGATTVTGDVTLYSDGSNGTAIDNAGTITHTTGNGYIYARSVTNSGTITATGGTLQVGTTSSGYAASNSGTITADGASTNVYIQGLTNTGTLRAQNSGKLFLQGNSTTPALGTLQVATGGHVYLNGTVDNTGATFTTSGGLAELLGGTIQNGSIASGALTFTTSGGVLDHVALLDSLIALPTNAFVTFNNGTTLAGGANLAANATVYWDQAGSLANGALTFGSNASIYLNAANASLTLASTVTASGTIGIYSDTFSANTAINTAAALTHTGGSGYLFAKSFANTGAITATGGTLSLGTNASGYAFANNFGGSITVNGASAAVQLFAPAATTINNAGTINVANGTLYTNGTLTNTTGTITGAGVISGGLKVDGGTIAPGNNGIGSLNFINGSLLVTNPATYSVDLGGATSDQLVFQNPPSIVNIGSGLVSLSLNLTAAPTAASYNLIRISSGGSGITGTFAGLPNNGDVFSASFNSTPYFFAINYGANAISVSALAVPEPSTYALFGIGLAVLPFLRRRKR